MESQGSAKQRMLADIRRALQGSAANTARTLSEPTRQSAEQIRKKSEVQRTDLISQFESELVRLGVRFHKALNLEEASQYVERIALEHQSTQVVTWDAPIISEIGVLDRLSRSGIDVLTETVDEFLASAAAAQIGVSGVDYAISDTGTLVLFSRKGQARSISLLPPVHIALVKANQLIAGIGDLFDLLAPVAASDAQGLWSAITFITGPSRTADIELKLVVGVHGPQHLHVVVLDDRS